MTAELREALQTEVSVTASVGTASEESAETDTPAVSSDHHSGCASDEAEDEDECQAQPPQVDAVSMSQS